jgi:hypothetical protein
MDRSLSPQFATSYFGNRILRHAVDDMRALRQSGFDIVVHTFSEDDLRFYQGTVTRIVSASKETGLCVWLDPWGVGGIFGGESFSNAALREPDWLQVASDGSPLPACCPNNPGFRGFVAEWIAAACATDADAVFWDEPHFFSDSAGLQLGCHCVHCRRDPARSTSMTDFLKWAFRRVVEYGKQNILCLVPDHLSKYSKASIQSFAECGLVNLGTNPFWFLRGEELEACIARAGSIVNSTARDCGIEGHIWIQGFHVPSGRESEVTQAVVAAARLAPEVIAFWGFEGCAAMSSLACEQPEVAWQCFLHGMRCAKG